MCQLKLMRPSYLLGSNNDVLMFSGTTIKLYCEDLYALSSMKLKII